MDRSNARIIALLGNEGVSLDGVYYCPHVSAEYVAKTKAKYGNDVFINPDFVRECREYKPMTGMIEKAVKDIWHSPAEPAHCRIYVIGDRVDADIELARRAKGIGVFVPSDVKDHSSLAEAHAFQKEHPESIIYVAKSFVDGASWILQRETKHLRAA